MQIDAFIAHHGKQRKASRGEAIFLQGDEDRSLYWVREGMLKACYIDTEGREHVKSFLQPGDFIGSLSAAFAQEICTFNLLCLSDVLLWQVSFGQLYEKAGEDLELGRILIQHLLDLAMKKERREYEFLCLSAEERYRLLIKRSPDLVRQVTQNEIARYLGITPVALSRIRGRMARRD